MKHRCTPEETENTLEFLRPATSTKSSRNLRAAGIWTVTFPGQPDQTIVSMTYRRAR